MEKNNESSTFAAKWRDGKVIGRGFACVPKCLFMCMDELDLKPQEVVVLINIIEKCWHDGDKAWPSIKYLAKNIGRKESATREILRQLKIKGYLGKVQRFNTTNLYDLGPCIAKLAEHMKNCRHTARNPIVGVRKSGGGDSQKTSDYIEAEIIRNTNETPPYSHIVTNNDDEIDIEVMSMGDVSHQCKTDSGKYFHDWGAPTVVYKGLNDFGTPIIWKYLECKRCHGKFHTKENPRDYDWVDGKLINKEEYYMMDIV